GSMWSDYGCRKSRMKPRQRRGLNHSSASSLRFGRRLRESSAIQGSQPRFLPESGQQIAATAEDLRSLVNSKFGTLRASNGFSAMSRWLRGAAFQWIGPGVTHAKIHHANRRSDSARNGNARHGL